MSISSEADVAPLALVEILAGVFVGGASRRMGQAKGLLPSVEGKGSLVERAFSLIGSALPGAGRVLVGERSEYAALGLPTIPDAAEDSGPLAGLLALLKAGEREGYRAVLAVACDLPYFQGDLLRRLALGEPREAPLAPFLDDRFQPLFARYPVSACRIAERALVERRLSLQPLLSELGAVPLELLPGEAGQLRDWDRPEDLPKK